MKGTKCVLPQTVWHVGRTGDVAGGMTQVVNSYLRWKFTRTRMQAIQSRDGSGGLRALSIFLGAGVRILRIPRRRRQAVAVHLSQGGSFLREGALLRLAALRGIPTIVHIHGSSFVDYASSQPGRVGGVLRRANEIVVLSEPSLVAAQNLAPDISVTLLPNAVESVAEEELSHKGQVIIFGGSVSRRKGAHVLLQAWERLSAERDGWRLEIAGPVKDVEISVEAAGVRAVGSVSHGDLMKRLAAAQVAILPSFDEAMPMFILESMARGCAVISTRVGGIPQVLNDGAGVIVEPGDVDELTLALKSVLGDQAYRTELGERARTRHACKFSLPVVAPQLESVWERAINEREGDFDARKRNR